MQHYLWQNRDVLLQRNQGSSSEYTMSSQLNAQWVVQRWLQVGHVHPGPGHADTHTRTYRRKVNTIQEQNWTKMTASNVACTYQNPSRAPVCGCWWLQVWPAVACLLAPPLEASGGRRSRRCDLRCCCKRRTGTVRVALASLRLLDLPLFPPCFGWKFAQNN